MSKNDDLSKQQELERIREQQRQEMERQIRRDEELRQIAINKRNDVISKGRPTGDRPGEDD